MVDSLRPQILGARLTIIFSVFLTFTLVCVEAVDNPESHTGDNHVHTDDHEGTQNYGQECLLGADNMQCKSGKGLHCNALAEKATCICHFNESIYNNKVNSCVAMLNKPCRISQISIPCDDPNASCKEEKNVCECKPGLECKSGGVPTIPGFTVLMTLAIATGFTYMFM